MAIQDGNEFNAGSSKVKRELRFNVKETHIRLISDKIRKLGESARFKKLNW